MQSVNKAEAGRELILNDVTTTTTTETTSVATVSATLATICNTSTNGDRQLTSEHFLCASASYLLCFHVPWDLQM